MLQHARKHTHILIDIHAVHRQITQMYAHVTHKHIHEAKAKPTAAM